MRNAMTRTFAIASAAVLTFGLSACGDSGKPSQAEYETALSDLVSSELPDTAGAAETEIVNKLVTCIADESYEDVSADAINDLVDSGADAKMSTEDQDVVMAAMQTCQTQLTDEITGGTTGDDAETTDETSDSAE